MKRAVWMFALLAVLTGSRVAVAGEPAEVDVYVSGREGYHTYRIPSLIVSAKGTLLAFCEGRKNDRRDHGNLDLVLRRSTDGGRTWLPMQLVYEEGGDEEITIGNPCPVIDQATGTIWLPFCRDNDDVLITSSADDGATWSPPREITSDVKRAGWGWYATGPGVGIQLERGPHRGRLVIPCDHREEIDGESVKMSHVFYSDDGGESWVLGASVDRHTDECQVVELENGDLSINMRNYWGRSGGREERGGMRAVATSSDGGASWSAPRFDATLVEPVCQASLIRFRWAAGDRPGLLLFSNPASASKRHRMTVRASFDEGATWPVARLIYDGSAAYSNLARLPDGSVGLLYEKDDYGHIVLATISLDWLLEGADSPQQRVER